MTPEEITVWSTWTQWVEDGAKFGFIDAELAESMLRHSEDGLDRMIIEVGMRVRP